MEEDFTATPQTIYVYEESPLITQMWWVVIFISGFWLLYTSIHEYFNR